MAPMLDDGCGVFYRIVSDKVVYSLSSWKYSNVTDLDRCKEHINTALSDVFEMYGNLAALPSTSS